MEIGIFLIFRELGERKKNCIYLVLLLPIAKSNGNKKYVFVILGIDVMKVTGVMPSI
jgi:hypothetical protein